jgi:hypothetical protein
MAIKLKDTEFRLSTVSLLDFKSIEMDRVLTGLFARIKHGGYDSRLSQAELHTIDTFAEEFLDEKNSTKFRGFNNHKRVLKQWLETHLLDLVNRGKPGQAVAAPRPLHGYTYRFRNSKHCRDYGAAPQIYELLWSARSETGKLALERLRQFFFEGVDSATNKVDCSIELDVETQALLSALTADKVTQDAQKPNTRELHEPLCIGSADLMANDILRLLSYRAVIPRSVMVEYLKILLAFHLALYHLRLLKILPALVKRKAAEPLCQRDRCPVKPSSAVDPFGACPYRIGLFVDVGGKPDSRIARLAVQSADVHYRRIPPFVRANYVARKLDEFGRSLLALGRILGGTKKALAMWELLQLLDAPRAQERDEFFGMRLMSMVEETKGEDDAMDPEIQRVVDLKLGKMDTYIECLVALRGDYHRSFVVRALDSFMLKNRPGALLAQTRAKGAPRRFVLDSRLLEVLLQLAVLEVNGTQGFYTREIRIEDLLVFLRERYGIYIDALPVGEGFSEPSIEDREALRQNKAGFKEKLRDIGFFQDLSDAYVTQHVTPRYRIEKEPANAAVPAGGNA